MGINQYRNDDNLLEYFRALADRLRRVRVCCGDWTRVLGDSPTVKLGVTAILLDPPYSAEAERDSSLYGVEDDSVAHDVRRWAIEHGNNPLLRIALCGYESEHDEHMPDDWEVYRWKAAGGYGLQGNGTGRENTERETIWFSPHCLSVDKQLTMFDLQGAAL
jgi:site-specific DNA-adenine methylase